MDGGNLIGMRLWKGVRKVLRQLLDLRIRLKGREAKSNERHHMQAINMELSINIICVAGTSRVGARRKRDTSLQEMNPYWHSFKEDTHNSRSSHGMSLVTRPTRNNTGDPNHTSKLGSPCDWLPELPLHIQTGHFNVGPGYQLTSDFPRSINACEM